MKGYSSEVCKQQHKTGRKVNVFPSDIVMAKLHVTIANSNKLTPSFTGPYKITEVANGNKYKIQHIETGETSIRHVVDLKKANMTGTEIIIANGDEEDNEKETGVKEKDAGIINDHNENHEYGRKLRSYSRDNTTNESENVLAIYSKTENLLEKEFQEYVQEMLDELGVDCNSFYR